MSLYSDAPTTNARSNYVYLGIGDYVVNVLEVKDKASDLKFIVELEIAEVIGDVSKASHRPGDCVSWLANYGGKREQAEMGKADAKAFNLALIMSAGSDPSAWTRQQWEEFGQRCARPENVSGVKVRVKATQYTKKDGTPGLIPRTTWIGLKGQPKRDALVSIYGASTTSTSTPPAAPKRPPLPPTPGGVAKHPQHATAVDAMRGYKEAGEEYGLGSELHAWATGEGFSESQYKAALAEAG